MKLKKTANNVDIHISYIILSDLTVLELPHTVVGAAIAAKIGNPALSLPLALASHFALDLLPHWNPHLNTELNRLGKLSGKTVAFIATDVILSLTGGFLIASTVLPDQNQFAIVILGSFMGILPDLVEAPHFFLGIRWEPIERLIRFQKSIQNDAPPFLGILTQVLLLAAVFAWVF